jgi:hypothetical protein
MTIVETKNLNSSLWAELSENQSESINGGFGDVNIGGINVNVNVANVNVIQTNVAAIIAQVGGNLNVNLENNSAV